MHDQLEVQLLGGFSVKLGAQPLTAFRSDKARALLAYVAVQPDHDHSRNQLATLLWGESSEQAARTNLRIELSNLKKLLDSHPALEISRSAVRFHSPHATVDATAFDRGVSDFLALPPETQTRHLPRLLTAIDHYQGEFLAGFHLGDAIEYEDWQLILREQLHEQMVQALETLQRSHAQQARWTDLAEAARRHLAIVPWHESAHRSLIQALAAQGDTQAALGQYERCQQILQEELGVEPSLATQELVSRLHGDRTAPSIPQHNLPQLLKTFVGRQEEATHLHDLVRSTRLVTLLGIGGVGKSHLARSVAQAALPDFSDGVWFVPLANIETNEAAAERIALAIAAAIGFPVTDLRDPLSELVTHLAAKRMLLVLDNWDHLTAYAETALYPLLDNTSIHILATSRARLMIEGEAPVRLGGLPSDEAAALFVDRAQRIVPTFGAEEAGADAEIAEVCRQVDGLPLGIELAASWVEHYSVAEIGQSIAEISVEPKRADDHVLRHHSLSSIFEYSWRLLTPVQQQILARLSVFRGGFDRVSAATVAESGLSDLSALIGHSLVQRIAAGRYDLHPLIQEFAGQKLTPDEARSLQSRHNHHFLPRLKTTPQIQWAKQIFLDFENVRAGWQHAIRAGDAQLVEESVAQFGEFMAHFGLMTDAEALMGGAVAQFEGKGVLGDREQGAHNELVAHLLDTQWRFARATRGLKTASALQHRLLTLTRDLELQVKTHIDLGNFYAEEGAWDQFDHHFDQVEALTQASDDPYLYISAVESRIHINAVHFRGDFGQGLAQLEEALALFHTLKEPDDNPASAAALERASLHTQLLNSLSLLGVRYGDYALAIRFSQQLLENVTDSGHRQQQIWALLDVALAEQFAGLYEDAIAHNQEALALAQKTGALDDVGLLSANLCLTLRQAGDLDQALRYGIDAIDTLSTLKLVRMEGMARNRIGHTLLALERWAAAYTAYEQALAVWETLQHPNRYEALAGCAVTAFHLNRHEEATELIEEALSFVETAGLQGIVEPVLLLLNSETVLSGLGQKKRARAVLQQAQAWVEQIAARISDEAIQRAFLNRPDNQLLSVRLRTAMADSKTSR